ncbi:trithorax group protein osa-like [Diaphorina citri]|uniref:Trithorax group protein osa-like n=1 Tax=Diaphorina citri TaxID=121845 RepID=A0A1S4EHA7_DIACI|nr:trithorax group protein osa-like [Diaphorina citri]
MPLQKGALWFFMLRLLLVCSQEVTEEQSDVTILRQINRLNDDGSYTFGYEAADGSFKIETRDVGGNVKGMFGFVDENGELKRISYSARNGTGFQASGTIATPVENARLNPSYTTVKPPAHHPFLKRPILILKAMVPEVTEDSESEENESESETSRQPYYSEEYSRRSKQGEREFLRNTKPVPFVDSNELTSGRPVLTRKILLGKRPSEDINEKRPRGGSGGAQLLSRGGDTADTRGTGSNGYINGQAPAIPAKLAVLANLMNEFEASSRSYTDNGYASQEQYPKVAYSEPDYVDYADAPTPTPVPRLLQRRVQFPERRTHGVVLTRKILLGKRPSEDINEKRPRGGSGLRRQLSRGGDTADTRGTGSNGYINGQAPAIPAKLAVLANLMNEFEASSRSYTDSGYASQEQYPKVAYSEPDYVDYADAPTPTPVPVPRQFYPITTPIPPPPTPGYQGRPIINPGPYRNPIYPGIPRDSYNVAYNSLREELMEYILQILQQRLVPGQYGSPLGQYPSQTIAPPPLPYGYDQGYNPLRSYIPSPAYPPQSFLPPRYPLGPGPYLGGRNYPQQPIPVVSPTSLNVLEHKVLPPRPFNLFQRIVDK